MIDSRLAGEGQQIRRRRECLKCGERFTTFETAELVEPRDALEAAGVETVVIAPKAGEIQGAEGDKPGDLTMTVDELLEDADPENYDAVLLPGGALNADHLRTEPEESGIAHYSKTHYRIVFLQRCTPLSEVASLRNVFTHLAQTVRGECDLFS